MTIKKTALDLQGFYKNHEGQLLYGPNFVINSEYELRKEIYTEYQYPIDGWYWFEDENQARAFFQMELVEIIEE